MFYLALAICSSALISIGMRVSGSHVSNQSGMLAVNYAVCTLLAAVYAGPTALFPPMEGLSTTLCLGAVGGFFYLAGFLLFQWNISQNGLVLPATFMKLGVLVPTLLSLFVFREQLRLWQGVGCLGALAAILLIHFEGKGSKAGNRWALILLLLGGGMADAMSKIYEELGTPALSSHFLFYTFLTALLLCTGLAFRNQNPMGRGDLLFGMLVGIPNYFSSRFLLLSLSSVPAVVAFPTFSVATILAVSAAGILFFKETLSPLRRLAIGLILVSLVLLNL